MPWITSGYGSQVSYPWVGTNNRNQRAARIQNVPANSAITQLKVRTAGRNGSVSMMLAVWDWTTREALGVSSIFTAAQGSDSTSGQTWYTRDVTSPPKVTAQKDVLVGFYHNPNTGSYFAGSSTGGNNLYEKTNTATWDSITNMSSPANDRDRTGMCELFYILIPNDPTSVVLSKISSTHMKLTWNHTATADRPVKDFIIGRSVNGGTFQVVDIISGGATKEYNDYSVSAGNTYQYLVRADNAAGVSAQVNSNTINNILAPTAPTNFSGTVVGATQINLTWQYNPTTERPVTLLRIQRSVNAGGFSDVHTMTSGTGWNNTGLTAGFSYQYRIRTENAVGVSAWTTSSTYTTIQAPDPVTNLVATRISDARIDITWEHIATEEKPLANFRVQRSINGGAWSDIGTPTLKELSNTGLSANNTYRYQVRAENTGGNSAYVASTTIKMTPGALTSCATQRTSDTNHKVTWTLNSNASQVNDSIRLERWDNVTAAYQHVSTLGATAVEHIDTTTVANRRYRYRVRAQNTTANGAWADGAFFYTTPSPMTVIDAVVSGASIDVTWTLPAYASVVILTQRLQKWDDVSNVWSDLETFANGTTVYHSDSNIEYGVRYRYRIRGENTGVTTTLTSGYITSGYVQTMVADSYVDGLTLSFDAQQSILSLLTGMTLGSQYSMATLQDKVVIVNGVDANHIWDGIVSAPEEMTGIPKFSIVGTHHNRVFGVETAVKSRVRFSNILDPTIFDALDFLDFNPNDGDVVTAFMRYGDYFVVSKKRSMALLTGDTKSTYGISWLENEQGVVGQRGICQSDAYLSYVAQDGIRFSDLSQSFVASEKMSSNEWSRVNKRRVHNAAMVYWNNYLLVSLPVDGSQFNNEVWAFDFWRGAWAIYTGWNVAAWLKFHQYGEEVLIAVDSTTGQAYNVMKGSYDDASVISYVWKSKEFHFNAPERYKLFRNIYLDLSGVSEPTDIIVRLFVDGEYVGQFLSSIPAGEGVKHTRRILPPIHDAVLGRSLSVEVEGRCGVQGISMEYVIKGAVPGGDYD